MFNEIKCLVIKLSEIAGSGLLRWPGNGCLPNLATGQLCPSEQCLTDAVLVESAWHYSSPALSIYSSGNSHSILILPHLHSFLVRYTSWRILVSWFHRCPGGYCNVYSCYGTWSILRWQEYLGLVCHIWPQGWPGDQQNPSPSFLPEVCSHHW